MIYSISCETFTCFYLVVCCDCVIVIVCDFSNRYPMTFHVASIAVKQSWQPWRIRVQLTNTRGKFYWPGWVSNHIASNVWDQVINPFQKSNDFTTEIREWIRYFTHFIIDVITFPCRDLNSVHVSNWDPRSQKTIESQTTHKYSKDVSQW